MAISKTLRNEDFIQAIRDGVSKSLEGYLKDEYEAKKKELLAGMDKRFYDELASIALRLTNLCDLCRNRFCVNPNHLEPVPHRENQLRGESFVGKKARQTHCIHGHKFTKANTLVRKDGRRNCRACARGSDN